ncbi:MAG: hypothetical protein CEE38_17325 [Planctomycetes bacterium B3_Pla]|nr:MAG: hypothetical protein CEE38_17325 [Planctomycetes bacterium B3_Pla]
MDTETHDNNGRFPELMTEAELVEFLRIPAVSKGDDYGNVVANLKRMRDLPCIHICRQPLYPREAIQRWIQDQTEKEQPR